MITVTAPTTDASDNHAIIRLYWFFFF